MGTFGGDFLDALKSVVIPPKQPKKAVIVYWDKDEEGWFLVIHIRAWAMPKVG